MSYFVNRIFAAFFSRTQRAYRPKEPGIAGEKYRFSKCVHLARRKIRSFLFSPCGS